MEGAGSVVCLALAAGGAAARAGGRVSMSGPWRLRTQTRLACLPRQATAQIRNNFASHHSQPQQLS